MRLAQKIAPYYFGFVKFQPPYFPNVDVYAEKGSGLPTVVGIQLPDLTVGQVLGDAPVLITRDGDSNQEDITNDAVSVWQAMPCYRFEFNDNPGVDHMSLALGHPGCLGAPADAPATAEIGMPVEVTRSGPTLGSNKPSVGAKSSRITPGTMAAACIESKVGVVDQVEGGDKPPSLTPPDILVRIPGPRCVYPMLRRLAKLM